MTIEKEEIGNFKAHAFEVVAYRYVLYIDGELRGDDPTIYDHYTVYSQATPNDVIELNIKSPGGCLYTAYQYISQMKTCQARIVGIPTNLCASGGSAILMHCDEWIIQDFARIMIHGIESYGGGGKPHDIHTSAEVLKEEEKDFLELNYKGFLTEEEISTIIRCKDDMTFNAAQIRERLENLIEYRESLEEQDSDNFEETFTALLDELKESCDNPQEVEKPKRGVKNARKQKGETSSN